MRVPYMSIDPSLRNTAIVTGTTDLKSFYPKTPIMLETKPNTKSKTKILDFIGSIGIIFSGLRAVLEATKPRYIFIERPSGSQSVKARDGYAMSCTLIAVLRNLAAEYGAEVIISSPKEVKLAAVGDEKATKAQMVKWASEKYPDFNWFKNRKGEVLLLNEHLADACAIAEAGLKKING